MEFKLDVGSGGLLSLPPHEAQVQPSPNVVFISIDDLNDWIGALDGYVNVKTPNLDRLAAQGIVFENAHTPVPVCNAARTAVMTGLQPDTTGIFDNKKDWRNVIPEGETIPEYFRQNGYESVGAGKLFHYSKPEVFEQYFSGSGVKVPKDQKGRFGTAALDVPIEAYRDVQVAQFARDYLSQYQGDSPFFLGVGFSRPHIPLTAPQEFFDLYPLEDIQLPNVNATEDLADIPLIGQQLAGNLHERIVESGDWAEIVQAYLANISFMDAQVGQVLDAIEDNGLGHNTVIALWSDHGWHLGEKLHWQKRTLWEEATRVPLIISAPGVESGTSTDAPVSLVDLFPTLVDLTGIAPKENLEGNSLIPLLENPQSEWPHAVISTWDNSYSVRTKRWRYIRYWDGTEELYDHQTDPNEFDNVADDSTLVSVKNQLSNQLNDYFLDYAPDRLPAHDEGQRLLGNNQDNILTGGGGNDTLLGRGGDDTIFGGAGRNELLGGEGNDFVAHISNKPGLLLGNSGEDRLVGGRRNDTLNGGAGNDLFEGRGGKDLYVINSIRDRILDAKDNRGDSVIASVNWSLQSYFSDLTLTGKARIGRGNEQKNRIIGNRQSNALSGDAGNDILAGEKGDDLLVGGLGQDQLFGGDGDDTLDGSDGVDTIKAEKDADFQLTDEVLIGAGEDVLLSIESVQILGGNSDNRLDASEFTRGVVELRGAKGNDTLTGGAQNDLLHGGAGIDTLVLNAKQETIRLTDTEVRGDGIDQLISIEQAILIGNEEDNMIDASQFNGTTVIEGREGNDRLVPSQGNSQMVGNVGADTFYLNRLEGDNIEIVDFASIEGDVLSIDADILGDDFVTGQQIDPGQFVVGSQFDTAQQRFLFNPEDKFLWFDMDGIGAIAPTQLGKISSINALRVEDLMLS